MGGLCALFLVLSPSLANCAEFNIGDYTLDIPHAFQPHVATKPTARTRTYVFSIEVAAVPKPTITVVRQMAERPALGMDSAELLEVADTYAREWVAAARKRRTEFKSSEATKIVLAGRPAIDIVWTGKMSGVSTQGRLFVLATQTDLYYFQVMGVDPPTPDMLAAISAIKKLQVKNSDDE